ncbi:MAG TPA: purine-nucleoside phosphorylase [Ignavibacteria bacterium]|nr:purine-nucleoside phosphorylase [Bacteroidota bacterium]HRE11028.1 purine-nucleoside phosphorylase [Ignavibacteria bacterium]HRF65698.1 purine-nucleoside phosphorylase [Ignavibacteria bacterium]HRJ04920.1 purine-nucleoside phosphorylase [Ignavibacteria bacterium]HRJ86385.1 purine-nucleoside phosphorylase [Ignavibacteria bacterium]
MTEQKNQIKLSADFIKANSPFKGKVNFAVMTFKDPAFLKEYKIVKKINYSDIPPEFTSGDGEGGEFIYAQTKNGKKNFYILNGHLNFYSGYKMREAAHPVYVLNELGVKNVIVVDEAGYLNPRFKTGGVALVYDHINLMGDNPLIGENDNSLGTRFPDMSDPYDEKWYNNIAALLREKKFEFYPSVYLGVTGPETETEAECRFYREIGADILGYALVPENIAMVHAGMKCAAFCMLSRELVADRLLEILPEEKNKNRAKAEKAFAPILSELVALAK